MPINYDPVVEIAANTTLDDALVNGTTLVCSQPVTLRPAFVSLNNGFACTVVNNSSGTVSVALGVTPSSGPLSIPPGRSAELRASTYAGGCFLFSKLDAVGEVCSLGTGTIGPNSVAVSWQAPSSGDAVSNYLVNYRMTKVGGAWTSQSTEETSLTVSGLSSATQYDFQVVAAGATGSGPASPIVTATTACIGNYLLTTGFLPVAGSTWLSTSGGIGVNVQDNSAPVDGSHAVPASVAFAWSLDNGAMPTSGLTPGMQFAIDAHKYWGVYFDGPGSAGDYYLWAIARDADANVVQALCWPSAFTFS